MKKRTFNIQNLRPIQPGERRAAKPAHLRREKKITIALTAGEHEKWKAAAEASGLPVADWVREKIGLDP